MNKTKIIILSLGGFFLIGALAFGWFIYQAMDEHSSIVDDLDSKRNAAERLTRGAIYPSPAAKAAVDENRRAYETWMESSRALATAGDLAIPETTPPAFKTQLIDDAKELSLLSGGVDGKIVKPDFTFGFKDFIAGGVLPSAANLPRLQREWNDVTNVVRHLAAAGVIEIVNIAVAAPVEPPKPKPVAARRAKKRVAGKTAAAPAAARVVAPEPNLTTMTVEFRTAPEGLVAALNRLVADRRYIAIADLTFEREKDEIVEKLGGDQKKDAKTKNRKLSMKAKRLEEKRAKERKDKQEDEQTGVIVDPQGIAPYKVKMTLSVADFRTGEKTEETEESATEEEE